VTVAEALGAVQGVGTAEVSEGKLKLRFPEKMRATLQPAIDTLRNGKAEALARLAEPDLTGRGSSLESEGIPWAEWKAAALNRLFQEQGATGKPGRITAATVRSRHGVHCVELDLPPVLRQTVKTQNPLNGELSHGVVT
jgi:hypothetical protein